MSGGRDQKLSRPPNAKDGLPLRPPKPEPVPHIELEQDRIDIPKPELEIDDRMFKIWVAVGDGKTRETHTEADGQVVPMGEKFEVGDAKLDAPRDPNGPPEETLNCRCLHEFKPFSELTQEQRRNIVGLDESIRQNLEATLARANNDKVAVTAIQRQEIQSKLADIYENGLSKRQAANLQNELEALKRDHNIDIFDISKSDGDFVDSRLNERARRIANMNPKKGFAIDDFTERRLSGGTLLRLVQRVRAELDQIEAVRASLNLPGAGKTLFSNDEIFLIPTNSNDAKPVVGRQSTLGNTHASSNANIPILFNLESRLSPELVKGAITSAGRGLASENIVGLERGVTERDLLAYQIRHELGHAMARQRVPADFIAALTSSGGLQGFERDYSGRHTKVSFPDLSRPPTQAEIAKRQATQEREIWAEAFAWFTSSDYPRQVGSVPPRLPLDMEQAIISAL